MQPSMFNCRVPTGHSTRSSCEHFTDAQLIVSSTWPAARSSRAGVYRPGRLTSAKRWRRWPRTVLVEEPRGRFRDQVRRYFHEVCGESREQVAPPAETLQCNFASIMHPGGPRDYNKHATKMSLDTAAKVADWAEQRLDALRPES